MEINSQWKSQCSSERRKAELTAKNQLWGSDFCCCFLFPPPQDLSRGYKLLHSSCGHSCPFQFHSIVSTFKLGRFQHWLGAGFSSAHDSNKLCHLPGHTASQPLLALETQHKSTPTIITFYFCRTEAKQRRTALSCSCILLPQGTSSQGYTTASSCVCRQCIFSCQWAIIETIHFP